ncbi:MAG TPA: hypothetical protein VM848_11385 [Acidimicrobiia bacterium]|nr:hypothetical protein [Acidimicrobiia bacterium]
MSSPHLLRPFPSRQLGLIEGDDRVVVFGVLGGRRLGSTILVHSPTLLLRLDQLNDGVELVVFVEDSPPDAATVATIDDMLAAMGSEDGLVQFQVAAEAIKLTKEDASRSQHFIGQGIDRSTLVSFRSPEVLRASALVAAVTEPPTELWVNPAGLIAASGGTIGIHPRPPSAT